MTFRSAPGAFAALVIVALALVVLVASGDAGAARRDWTGSAACGRCHPRELAAWQRTAHATTARRLPGRHDGRCLACHATGEAPAGAAIELAVGCEACHGAGAAYAEDDVMRDLPVARALGLVDLGDPKQRAAVCARCHARPTRAIDLTQPVHPAS